MVNIYNDTFDQYEKRFTLDRADYKYLKTLDAEKSNMLQSIIEELYNINGEISVKKHLQDTREMDELLVDYIDTGGVSTDIYEDPYRLNIFIPAYPPHLKEHNKTKFSPELGYLTKMRWQHYMSCAIHNLRAKGATRFEEKVIVIAKFHFPRDCYNVDNYAISFINDTLKFSNLIGGDNYTRLSVLSCGVTDEENKGLEIIIISQNDFNKDPLPFI